MLHIQKHLDLLGRKVEDSVTGFKGVATSISFDLYGCVQAIVNPGLDKDDKLGELHYFDVARLKCIADEPVMPRPNFDFGPVAEGLKGPSERPRMTSY